MQFICLLSSIMVITFKNKKGAQSKNTYNLNSILRDFFDKHKSKTYSNNSIFITRYRYNVYWVTKKPAYLVWGILM